MVTSSNGDISSNRPYPPPSNVVSLLKRLRSRNLPDIIDSEYLRDSGIPEGTIARTLFAMRFLGLITGAGSPTEALRSIHTSTDEDYRMTLSKLIRESYQEVFNGGIKPEEDSQDKIVNVFRRYTPASQRKRMVIFFLGMCREAGIPTLEALKSRRMTVKQSKERTERSSFTSTASKTRSEKTRFDVPLSSINPAIEGLMKSLPEPGKVMSEDRRKQWIAMADATLKFLYPEKVDLTSVETTTTSDDEKK